MNNAILSLIAPILKEPLRSDLLTKQIVVSKYPVISSAIPDDKLTIDEVFPEEELDIINERFSPYLSEYCVFPILGIVGGSVVAIGYSSNNEGAVYYYDFDFGIFNLDSSINEFISNLE